MFTNPWSFVEPQRRHGGEAVPLLRRLHVPRGKLTSWPPPVAPVKFEPPARLYSKLLTNRVGRPVSLRTCTLRRASRSGTGFESYVMRGVGRSIGNAKKQNVPSARTRIVQNETGSVELHRTPGYRNQDR